MVAKAGRLFLLRLDTNGAGAYSNLAGVRSRSFKFNSETVDVTNSDSVNQYRELGANMGVKSFELTGAGVLLDAAIDASVIGVAMNGTIRNWQVYVPGIGTYQGPFQISAKEDSGDYNGAVEFSITAMSAGEIAFTGE